MSPNSDGMDAALHGNGVNATQTDEPDGRAANLDNEAEVTPELGAAVAEAQPTSNGRAPLVRADAAPVPDVQSCTLRAFATKRKHPDVMGDANGDENGVPKRPTDSLSKLYGVQGSATVRG
jgi:hypothetical protein